MVGNYVLKCVYCKSVCASVCKCCGHGCVYMTYSVIDSGEINGGKMVIRMVAGVCVSGQ